MTTDPDTNPIEPDQPEPDAPPQDPDDPMPGGVPDTGDVPPLVNTDEPRT